MAGRAAAPRPPRPAASGPAHSLSQSPMEAFLCGGSAAIVAITCTHPIDVVKTRLQVQGELQLAAAAGAPKTYNGIAGSLATIFKHEGVRGLYRGLLPAYGLQFSVTAVRFAVYDVQKRVVGEEFGKGSSKGQQSNTRNFAMGAMGGVAGAVCGCPWYLIKTQFQTYSTNGALASVGTQHGHQSVLSAFQSIGQRGGVLGYWRGFSAFLPRVCIYSGVQLSTYDGIKSTLLGHVGLSDTFTTHCISSFVTTCAAVTVLQPFDFLSTRLMNQPDPPQYRHALDCAVQTVRTEGPQGFFKGGLTNYVRFGPYGILQLVLIEQFKAFSQHVRGVRS